MKIWNDSELICVLIAYIAYSECSIVVRNININCFLLYIHYLRSKGTALSTSYVRSTDQALTWDLKPSKNTIR